MKAKSSTSNQTNWVIVGVMALVGAFIFFRPFLAVICLSALTAYIFAPLYRLFARHMPNGVAAMLTMLSTLAIVVIPLAIILVLAISQGLAFAQSLSSLSTKPGSSLDLTAHPIADTINTALAPYNGYKETISVDSVNAFVKEALPAFIKAFIGIIVGLASSVPVLMTSAILYGFLFNTFVMHGAAIRRILKTISPFENKTSELYLERSGSIVKASLQGQLLVAFIMGVSCALLLFLIGLQSYFVFFVIIFTLLGMVPLGTGIVVVPMALIAMVAGQFWPGLWMLVIYLVVICNMDNFLRPRMMPKNAKLLPALITLSTFCGLYYFGILGVVYGPLIAVLLTTTLEAYTSYREQTQTSKPTPARRYNKGGQTA